MQTGMGTEPGGCFLTLGIRIAVTLFTKHNKLSAICLGGRAAETHQQVVYHAGPHILLLSAVAP